VTNASRTLLMDIATLEWDGAILKTLGIPRAMLPEIKSSSEVYGHGVGVLEGVRLAGARVYVCVCVCVEGGGWAVCVHI
jgi:glycerol kinase